MHEGSRTQDLTTMTSSLVMAALLVIRSYNDLLTLRKVQKERLQFIVKVGSMTSACVPRARHLSIFEHVELKQDLRLSKILTCNWSQ